MIAAEYSGGEELRCTGFGEEDDVTITVRFVGVKKRVPSVEAALLGDPDDASIIEGAIMKERRPRCFESTGPPN